MKIKLSSLQQTQSTVGEMKIQAWDRQERMKRAFKFGLICWGLAVVSILLPIVHFVSVPGLFLAGPFVFFHYLTKESAIIGGEGVCPHCQTSISLHGAVHRFPMTQTCSKCFQSFQVHPSET